MAPLFPGCDYEHLLIVMDKPGGKAPPSNKLLVATAKSKWRRITVSSTRIWKRRSLRRRESREQREMAALIVALSSLSLGFPIRQNQVVRSKRFIRG